MINSKGFTMYTALKYYVSDNNPEGLLLHRADCAHLPDQAARVFIGSCYSLNQARTVAAANFKGVKPCPHCVAKPEVKAKPATKVRRAVNIAAKISKENKPVVEFKSCVSPVRHMAV